MLKRTLILIAVTAAALGVFAGGAAAATATAPVLDGERFSPWPFGGGEVLLSGGYDSSRSSLTIGYDLAGGATGPYWPGFTLTGTAKLTGDGATLTALDSTFTIAGTVTGRVTAGPGTTGVGTYDVATGRVTLVIRKAIYTAQLPDGTTDLGSVRPRAARDLVAEPEPRGFLRPVRLDPLTRGRR